MLEDDKRYVAIEADAGPKGVATTLLGVEAAACPEVVVASFVGDVCRFCATKLIVVERIPFMISSSSWDFLTSKRSVLLPCAQASALRQKMIVRLDRVFFIFALLLVSG
jgi:hypothetical protein